MEEQPAPSDSEHKETITETLLNLFLFVGFPLILALVGLGVFVVQSIQTANRYPGGMSPDHFRPLPGSAGPRPPNFSYWGWDFPVPSNLSSAQISDHQLGFVWQIGNARVFLPVAYTAGVPEAGQRPQHPPSVEVTWPSRRGSLAYANRQDLEAARRRWPQIYMLIHASNSSAAHNPRTFSLLDAERFAGYDGPHLHHVETFEPQRRVDEHDFFPVAELREGTAPWTTDRPLVRVMRDASGLVFIACQIRPAGDLIWSQKQNCTMHMVRPNLLLEIRYPSEIDHAEVHRHFSEMHTAMTTPRAFCRRGKNNYSPCGD